MLECRRSHRQPLVYFVLSMTVAVYAIVDSIPANAENPAPDSGGLRFHLHVNRYPAIGKSLQQKIKQHIERSFEALFHDTSGCQQVDYPALDTWLDNHSLQQLTPQLCERLDVNRFAKTLILSLTYFHGTYEMAAVEYDRRLHCVSASRQRTTVQREMVCDHFGQLAIRSWSPVGRIVGKSGNSFVVSFPNPGAILRLRDFSQLKKTGSLQPYREIPQGHAVRQDRKDDAFLVIGRAGSRGFITTLAGGQSAENWFQFLGRRNVRYLARLVQPREGYGTVRVVEKATQQPREGCLVYVSDQKPVPPRLGNQQAITDLTGRAIFHSGGAELNYVTVVYGHVNLSKVYVNGANQAPLLFELPSRGARVELEQTLTRLEEMIQDAEVVLNDKTKRVDQAADNVDVKRLTELVEECQQFMDENFDLGRIKSELGHVRDKADENRYQDLVKRADRTLEIAATFDPSRILSEFREAKRAVIVKDLRSRIENARKSYEWVVMAQHLRALVEADPADMAAKRMLKELVKGLKVQNPEHATARGMAGRAGEFSTIDALLSHRREMNEALTVLLQLQDALTLIETADQLKLWNDLAEQEAKRLEKIAEASDQLSVQEKMDFEERSQQVQKLLQDLLVIRKRSAEITQELFQP